MISSFAKNTVIVFVSRIFQFIFALCVSVIIARALGPEKQGIYSLAILLPMFLITFTNFGIGSATIFYIGRRKYSLKEILSMNVICSIIIIIIAVLVGLITIYFFSDKLFHGVPQEYLLLALVSIPFQIFIGFALKILIGMKKFKKSSLIQVFQSFIFLILIIILFLFFDLSIKTIIASQIIIAFAICIVLFFQVKKEIGKFVFSVKKKSFKIFFRMELKII
jgi:O-antigen/teichoic acid export membrane protein